MNRKALWVMAVLFVVSTAVLAACSGGGGGGSVATNPSAGQDSVVYSALNAAPAASCPTGGITVYAGIDTNGNGVLDTGEITSTQYVCNGTNGTYGFTTLVSTVTETAGAHCSDGGYKVSVGLDTNGNSVLDPSEITSSNYICNGANGGTNGTNGLIFLTSIVSAPAGTNCAYGGEKITSGLDANNDGVLDLSEVTSTKYVCNGAGINWVDVTTTSVQAVSNTGYMADSASQVVITLPAAPALSDIVQVSGVGTGGWKIAQNAGQSVATKPNTTVGTAGSISGGQYDAVELQYIGNNTFSVLSNEGSLVVQ